LEVVTKRDQCAAQVNGFPGNKHKSFSTRAECEKYLKDNGVNIVSESESSVVPEKPKGFFSHFIYLVQKKNPKR
jgi:viroplasmin and RNaseH domain-containing protein